MCFGYGKDGTVVGEGGEVVMVEGWGTFGVREVVESPVIGIIVDERGCGRRVGEVRGVVGVA